MLNTIPIQQFVQLVKSADNSQQREIKMDIRTAKQLVFCITEMSTQLNMKYEEIISKNNTTPEVVTIQMDGGGFK